MRYQAGLTGMQVERKCRKVCELSKNKDHMWGEKPLHIYVLRSEMMDVNLLCNSNIIIFFIPAEACAVCLRGDNAEKTNKTREIKEKKRETREEEVGRVKFCSVCLVM